MITGRINQIAVVHPDGFRERLFHIDPGSSPERVPDSAERFYRSSILSTRSGHDRRDPTFRVLWVELARPPLGSARSCEPQTLCVTFCGDNDDLSTRPRGWLPQRREPTPFRLPRDARLFIIYRVRDGHPDFQIQTSPSDSSVEYRSS